MGETTPVEGRRPLFTMAHAVCLATAQERVIVAIRPDPTFGNRRRRPLPPMRAMKEKLQRG